MTRGSMILGALLAVSLVWAYAVSHPTLRNASRTDDTVAVWQLDPTQIHSVVYDDGEHHTELQRQDGHVWVQGTEPDRQRRRKKNEAEDTEGPPPKPFSFKGNPAADSLFSELASLSARRRIGLLADLKAEEFGLPAPDQVLELRPIQGDPLRLELGGESFGGQFRYVYTPSDGQVFLMAKSPLRDLEQASRKLVEKELWPFPLSQATRLEVAGKEGKLTLHRLNLRPGVVDVWGFRPEQEDGEPELQEFVNSLTRLKVQTYDGEGDDPLHENSEPLFSVDVFTEGTQPAAWLRVYEGKGAVYRAQTLFNAKPFTMRRSLTRPALDNYRKILQAQ